MYKRQELLRRQDLVAIEIGHRHLSRRDEEEILVPERIHVCLLYTSDAADERSSVDLGGRRIIKKKKIRNNTVRRLR